MKKFPNPRKITHYHSCSSFLYIFSFAKIYYQFLTIYTMPFIIISVPFVTFYNKTDFILKIINWVSPSRVRHHLKEQSISSCGLSARRDLPPLPLLLLIRCSEEVSMDSFNSLLYCIVVRAPFCGI